MSDILGELKKSTEAAIAAGEVVESLESGKTEDNENIVAAQQGMKRTEERVKVKKEKIWESYAESIKDKSCWNPY